MRKFTVIASIFLFPLLATSVKATPVVDLKSQVVSEETQNTQDTQLPTPTTTAPVERVQTTNQSQVGEDQPSVNQLSTQWTQPTDAMQDRINALEAQVQNYRGADPKITNWLGWWWQIGFWSGILLLFPWVFVGWQWTKFKFWGFGWPWPWWFWIPVVWWIPWVIIGWQWWFVWWVWWVWFWWLFPWVFWFFWWVIVFKELLISQWHRRGPSSKETLG